MKFGMKLTRSGKSFSRIGDDTRSAVAGAVRENAEDVLETAKRNVHVISGATRDSGRITSEGPLHAQVEFGEGAIYEELGTRFRPPHPFLAPAVEEVRPRAEHRMADALRAGAGRN